MAKNPPMSLFEKRPLALSALALLLASLGTLWLSLHEISPLFLLIPTAIFAATALFFLLRKKRGAPFGVAVALCLLAGILSQWFYAASLDSPLTDEAGEHKILITVESIAYESSTYRVCNARVEEIDGESAALSLRLRIPKELKRTAPSPGDRYTVLCIATDDYTGDSYYYGEGIAADVTVTKFLSSEDDASLGIAGHFRALNKTLTEVLLEHLGDTEGGFIAALFLGNRDALPDAVSLAFRRAGVAHALALSGMHLSVLTLFLRRLLRLLSLPRPVTSALVLLFIGSYTLLSGAPLSLLRAAAMLAIAEIGSLLRYLPDAVTSLFFSVALIVLVSPGAAADLGLWLSFLATLGLLTASAALPQREKGRYLSHRRLGALLRAIVFTLFALLFTLIITVFAFGEISLLSPISNLILSPLVSLLLLLTPPLFLFGANSLYTLAVKGIVTFVLSIAEALSSIPGVYLSVAYPLFRLAVLAFSLYLLWLLIRRLEAPRAFLMRLGSATLLLAAIFLSCHLYNRHRSLLFTVQHSAGEYVILSSRGHTAVVDNSESGASLYALKSSLKAHCITEIDTFILTHYTEETHEVLSALADTVRIGEVILADDGDSEALRESIYQRATARGLNAALGDTALTLRFGSVELRLLCDLDTPYLLENALLLYASANEKTAFYASSTAFLLLPEERLGTLLASADCVILGAHPRTDSPAFLPSLPVPKGCTIVAPYAAIGDLPDGVNFIPASTDFLFEFQ